MTNTFRAGGSLISQISKASSGIFQKLLSEEGLDFITEGQGKVLYTVHEYQSTGITCSKLTQATNIDKATLSGILDRMEKASLITRTSSKEDKRSSLVIPGPLFPKGIEEKFNSVSSKMIEIFYGDMSETQRDEADKVLKKLLANCKTYLQNNF